MNHSVRSTIALPLLACALLAGASRAEAQVKVTIVEYLDGVKATPVSANNTEFPMAATWSGADFTSGTGNYVLRPGGWFPFSPNFDGDYEASFIPGTLTGDYATHELTDVNGVVLPSDVTCVPGKYQLVGYSVGTTLLDAEGQAPSATEPNFVDLTQSRWVIVWNRTCPSLTVTKTTIGGNDTFGFTGDNGLGAFDITTTAGSGTQPFYNLGAATYQITETVPAGWYQVSNTCQSVTTSLTESKTCTVQNAKLLKVHILKYLDGQPATAVAASNYLFPMSATWNAANIGAGSGSYPLGNNFGGAANLYGADTSFMSAPADYQTSEITTAIDLTSQVLPVGTACTPGKFRLIGYSASATSFADAATVVPSPATLLFNGLTSDRYIIVWNETCPTGANGTLNVTKNTSGGNATFHFSYSGTAAGNFNITTVSTTGTESLSLAPGTYSVTEAPLAGWTQQSNTCTNVVVTAGNTASCTIVNTKVTALGEIRGRKCQDLTGTGDITPCIPLAGWTIFLDTNGSGTPDGVEPIVVTGADGRYRFTSLPAGMYRVREVKKVGWVQTFPAAGSYLIDLAAGEIVTGRNFGNFRDSTGCISGTVFRDRNANQVQNANDEGLANWTIVLTKGGSSVTTTSDANGNFSFAGLTPGTYTVTEVLKPGWFQTTTNPAPIVIGSGTVVGGLQFGNKRLP